MNRFLCYLYIISAFILLFLAPGCQNSLPIIELDGPADNHRVLGPSVHPLIVGDFESTDQADSNYGIYALDYLSKTLKSKGLYENRTGPGGDSTPDSKPVVLTGKVTLISTADPDNSGKNACKVEVTFTQKEKSTGSLVRTDILSEISSQTDEAGIKLMLRTIIDRYLDKIFIRSMPLKLTLERGWTDLDRQGRRLAAKGNYEGALDYFLRAADVRPDDHAALYNAGVMFEVSGEPDQAAKYYRRAAQLGDNPRYRQALDRVTIKNK